MCSAVRADRVVPGTCERRGGASRGRDGRAGTATSSRWLWVASAVALDVEVVLHILLVEQVLEYLGIAGVNTRRVAASDRRRTVRSAGCFVCRPRDGAAQLVVHDPIERQTAEPRLLAQVRNKVSIKRDRDPHRTMVSRYPLREPESLLRDDVALDLVAAARDRDARVVAVRPVELPARRAPAPTPA